MRLRTYFSEIAAQYTGSFGSQWRFQDWHAGLRGAESTLIKQNSATTLTAFFQRYPVSPSLDKDAMEDNRVFKH